MIRFIIVGTLLVILLLLSYLVFPIEWIVGKINKKARDYSMLRMAQCAFRFILILCGVKVTVIGKENMPKEPALYVGNHRSFFDIVVMYAQCDDLTGFVAKDSLNKIPSLRVWMRSLYCLFLDRKDLKQGMKTIVQAMEYVKQGVSMCIFPEGTRNTGEELSVLPFKEGSFKIALKTGCPIVPVSINNTIEIFENHIPKIKSTHVILEYGTPIYPKDLSRDEQKVIGATCQGIIQETIKKNAKML